MSGNETVDVARRPDFHLAYFFKKSADKHAVLLKEKELLFPAASGSRGGDSARRGNQHAEPRAKRPRVDVDTSEDEPSLVGQTEDLAEEVYIKPDPDAEDEAQDPLFLNEGEFVGTAEAEAEAEPEDVKPKFKIRVRYNGFKIFQKSLILVLEPSPSARARSPHLFASQQPVERRQLSMTPALLAPGQPRTVPPRSSRTPSMAPTGRLSSAHLRESSQTGSRRDASRTPLFRGSLTPSEAGEGNGDVDDPISDASVMMPPPRSLSSRADRPARRRDERMPTTDPDSPIEQPRSGAQIDEVLPDGELEAANLTSDVDFDRDNFEARADGEGGLRLAERMLLSQDTLARGAGVDDREQGVED
ncbi:unnamed protein product [Parajaminaea phylloscopi]